VISWFEIGFKYFVKYKKLRIQPIAIDPYRVLAAGRERGDLCCLNLSLTAFWDGVSAFSGVLKFAKKYNH
jgi:hypothetical protein